MALVMLSLWTAGLASLGGERQIPHRTFRARASEVVNQSNGPHQTRPIPHCGLGGRQHVPAASAVRWSLSCCGVRRC